MTATNESIVEYGYQGLQFAVKGEQTAFVDGGSEKRKLFMHRVRLTNLRPLTRYGKFKAGFIT